MTTTAMPLNTIPANDKIDRLVSQLCLSFFTDKSRTGETLTIHNNGTEVAAKLLCFDADYQRVIVELFINKLSIEKIILDKTGDQYRPLRRANYGLMYTKLLKAIRA